MALTQEQLVSRTAFMAFDEWFNISYEQREVIIKDILDICHTEGLTLVSAVETLKDRLVAGRDNVDIQEVLSSYADTLLAGERRRYQGR
jgi:hypothetical protein